MIIAKVTDIANEFLIGAVLRYCQETINEIIERCDILLEIDRAKNRFRYHQVKIDLIENQGW